MVYTTSSAFLQSLANSGITHAFVNWGSDHPALLEDIQRQQHDNEGKTNIRFITCPHEMVALSAAQGFFQRTGKPAAVIVHVDVGTQALGGAIHNVARSRTPVVIYAGASATTRNGELRGGRNEWIMWVQDVHDQTAIVRQYMRWVGKIETGKSVGQVVDRALQIATSEPKGPVYLWARRETMEEELSATIPSIPTRPITLSPAVLSPPDIERLTAALSNSENPLILTSYLGRNTSAVEHLVSLSTRYTIPIFSACPSALNVPFSHPLFLGTTYFSPGNNELFNRYLTKADLILVIECDLPWIPTSCEPKEDTRIFVLDSGDPLRTDLGFGAGWEHPGVEMVAKVNASGVLEQLLQASPSFLPPADSRKATIAEDRNSFTSTLTSLSASSSNQVPFIISTLSALLSSSSITPLLFNEAISNYPNVWNCMKADVPGSVWTSGGSSLGWALGAAVGAILGRGDEGKELPIAIVGDGSYLFGVPSTAFWMARRYQTPFLTLVLNNRGWKSPKLSMLGVHPSGYGASVAPGSGEVLGVGFGFTDPLESSDSAAAEGTSVAMPDYAGIAVAASGGWVWGRRLQVDKEGDKVQEVLKDAIRAVREQNRCAVIDCVLDGL